MGHSFQHNRETSTKMTGHDNRQSRDLQWAKECASGSAEAMHRLREEFRRPLEYDLSKFKQSLHDQSVPVQQCLDEVFEAIESRSKQFFGSYLERCGEKKSHFIPLLAFVRAQAREIYLVSSCNAGNPIAQRQFYREYRRYIERIVSFEIGNVVETIRDADTEDVVSGILSCLLHGRIDEEGTLYSYICGSEGRTLHVYDARRSSVVTFVGKVTRYCCKDVLKYAKLKKRRAEIPRIEEMVNKADDANPQESNFELFEIPAHGLSDIDRMRLVMLLNESIKYAKLDAIEELIIEYQADGCHSGEILKRLQQDLEDGKLPTDANLPKSASGIRDRWKRIREKLIEYWVDQGHTETIRQILKDAK